MKKVRLFVVASLTFVLSVCASQIHAQTANQQSHPARAKGQTFEYELFSLPSGGGSSKVPVQVPPVKIDTNRLKPIFYGGESIIYTVTPRKDLDGYYLYVFCVDSQGNTVCLYPNSYHQSNGTINTVTGGEQITIPAPGNPFRIVAAPPYGNDTVYCVLSRKSIDPKLVSAKSFTDSNATSIDTTRFKGQIVKMLENHDSYLGKLVVVTLDPNEKKSTAPLVQRECDMSEVQAMPSVRPGILGRLFK